MRVVVDRADCANRRDDRRVRLLRAGRRRRGETENEYGRDRSHESASVRRESTRGEDSCNHGNTLRNTSGIALGSACGAAFANPEEAEHASVAAGRPEGEGKGGAA